jgi:D-psicose/D-tagatose/L-ribulose 3-epimerase
MKPQNYKVKDLEVKKKFIEYRKNKNLKNMKHLNLSWSNWGFGIEPFESSIIRLSNNNIHNIELHGNKYGNDIGYNAKEVNKIVENYGVKVAGICGMVFPESEFASNNPFVRQRCIDYFRRNVDLCKEVNGSYILFAPGAVGRPKKYDENEFSRAAETINKVADYFLQNGVRGALEPVRPEEVSFCHTFAEAKRLLDKIDHPGVKHIAGDVFHMLSGEKHVASTLIEYGDLIINLHLADTNRRALGTGFLDLDLVIMALYIAGYNNGGCFCTPEPLGAGSNPYVAMYGTPESEVLDELVKKTSSYFYEREKEILGASDIEILNS